MAGPLTAKLTLDISDYTSAMTRARDLSARHAADIAQNFDNAAIQIGRSQRDAVASAKRGAAEIAATYIANGRAAQATVASIGLTTTAMSLGSGRALATLSGALRTGSAEFGKLGNSASESGSSVQQLADQFNILQGPIAKVMDGLAAWGAVKTVWSAFNDALEDTEARLARLNQIADTARTLGVSPTFLTQAGAQAKEARVQTESLIAMLERAREASRVQLGVGKDAVNESAFQARLRQQVAGGNLTAADVAPYAAARDQEAQIRAVLDLITKLKAESRELAANDLGRVFFGADFEAKTRQGIDLIGAFRRALDGAQAQGSGLAPTAEEIARAEEFRQREEAIAAIIRDAIAPAVHDFNELSDYGKRTWIEWEERVAGWVKWLGEGYLKVRDIASEVKKMAQSWELIAEDGPAEGGPLTVRVKPRQEKKPDRSNPLPSLTRSAREPNDPDSVANVIRQLERARDVAEAELKTVGMTNVERARAVALAKAEAAAREDVEKGNRENAALTEQERQRVLSAADATRVAQDRQKDLEAQLRANADAARYFGSALADAIGDAVLEGKSLSDVLGSIAKMLSRGALQALLTGTGPLASIFGTAPAASAGADAVGGLAGMFKNLLGFASGGPVAGPGTGTSDSILARLSHGEFVVNAASTAKHRALLETINRGSINLPKFATGGMVDGGLASAVRAGGAGAPNVVSIAPAITINAAGGTNEQNAALAAQIGQQIEGSMRSLVVQELRAQMRPMGMLNRT